MNETRKAIEDLASTDQNWNGDYGQGYNNLLLDWAEDVLAEWAEFLTWVAEGTTDPCTFEEFMVDVDPPQSPRDYDDEMRFDDGSGY